MLLLQMQISRLPKSRHIYRYRKNYGRQDWWGCLDNRHCHDHSFWIKKRSSFIGKIQENGVWTRFEYSCTNQLQMNGKDDPFPDATIYNGSWLIGYTFLPTPLHSLKTKPVAFVFSLLNSGQTFLGESKVFGNRCLGYLCFERILEKGLVYFLFGWS